MTGNPLAVAFERACLAELEAIKPGNVHVFADGHGMVVGDFIRSAHAAAEVIAVPGLTVGQRILRAVEATWQAVGCNTNLGIILLAAPMVHAVQLNLPLRTVLDALTVEDAELAFHAIVRASPAGLGTSPNHDVHARPQVTLLQAMQAAADRDFIARQYASGCADIFGFGLARFSQAMERWENASWATTAVYLGWLARHADSHVLRKLGPAVADTLRQEAVIHEAAFLACENPKNYLGELLRWDARLKQAGINPGTSADLTVATLLASDPVTKILS